MIQLTTSIHSYIFLAAFWTQGQQSQAVLEGEMGYTLDRWPVNHRADTERINWQAHMLICANILCKSLMTKLLYIAGYWPLAHNPINQTQNLS